MIISMTTKSAHNDAVSIGSGISPAYRGPDDRHGSRSPRSSRVGGSVRRRGSWSPGGGKPHGAGTPAGGPEASATAREARGTAPVGPGPVTHLRVQPLKGASAGTRSQATDPKRGGSGARVYAVPSGSSVLAFVAESVSGLAQAADCVRARRWVRPVLGRHRID